MAGSAYEPIHIPDHIWRRDATLALLRNRDVGALFWLAHQYAGASQNRIAAATSVPQPRVNALMNKRGGPILHLHVFENIADGLNMPDDARAALGLAPRSSETLAPRHVRGASTVIQPKVAPPPLDASALPGSLSVDLAEVEEDTDPVRRRTFHRVAAAGLFATVLADLPDGDAPLEGVEAFAAALAGYPDPRRPADNSGLNLDALATAVSSAKSNYQACHYSTVIRTLPGLLTDLRNVCDAAEGDARLRAHVLSAEAHHVAASILLKLDEDGLAWLAADRSMQAARKSEDPVIIGSSARIITHALMDDGHFGAATKTASTFAARLDRDTDQHTPDSLSVYGALLLRGAVAAGQRNDRDTANTLLNEAGEAGRRLGGDFNYRWTAFGPINVQLHRVNIAAFLGDAGQAVAEARTIDLNKIPITERKASLLIDTSRALTQWGKYDKAYEVLRAAGQLAPEEVSSRPAVHRLIRDLFAASPSSTRRHVMDFSTQIGVRL